jgi:hypothetical protein
MAGQRPVRVLLVGMADSIHVARWIAQFEGLPIEFVLFPSTPNRRVHPEIASRIASVLSWPRVDIPSGMKSLSFPLGLCDLALSNRLRAPMLGRVLLGERFDFIHALEFQHAGYLLERAARGKVLEAPVIATNWGSDIYWFRQFPKHAAAIRRLLGLADYYSSECDRDKDLAASLGFSGIYLPTNPNAGGIETERFRAKAMASPPSGRRVIAIKGYDRFVGMAPVALEAIERIAHLLGGYRIVFYSASRRMRRKVSCAAARTGLEMTAIAPYGLSHSQMIDLFLSARLYLGVSRSDGISTSLLEAMTTGCFPIQTGTSCANEWIVDGVTGAVIDGLTVDAVVSSLKKPIVDDALVDSAMAANLAVVEDRLSASRIRRDSLTFYGLTGK